MMTNVEMYFLLIGSVLGVALLGGIVFVVKMERPADLSPKSDSDQPQK